MNSYKMLNTSARYRGKSARQQNARKNVIFIIFSGFEEPVTYNPFL